MANVTSVLVYKINQRDPIALANVSAIGFPSTLAGMLIRDAGSNPATRSLSTGVNVYSSIQGPDGTQYYCRETVSQLVTLFG